MSILPARWCHQAQLTLINLDTGSQRSDVSDVQGRFNFAQAQPGKYKLTAKASGFSDVVVNDIRLLVNSPATINVTFEKIGNVATTISVEADAVQVNTVDASLGNAVSGQMITQFPSDARNVVGLLALQPGVVYLGEPEPGALNDYRSGAVNGGKSDQANVTLDGVDVNDQQNRSAFKSVLRVTLDSVQEFRTITTNAGADFGRTSGAQVALVTKSGSNTVHGALYEYPSQHCYQRQHFLQQLRGCSASEADPQRFWRGGGRTAQEGSAVLFSEL